jgi:hypothetical protein
LRIRTSTAKVRASMPRSAASHMAQLVPMRARHGSRQLLHSSCSSGISVFHTASGASHSGSATALGGLGWAAWDGMVVVRLWAAGAAQSKNLKCWWPVGPMQRTLQRAVIIATTGDINRTQSTALRLMSRMRCIFNFHYRVPLTVAALSCPGFVRLTVLAPTDGCLRCPSGKWRLQQSV